LCTIESFVPPIAPPPTCGAHAIAILLHAIFAHYTASRPLLCAIHHTILVRTTSCKGPKHHRGTPVPGRCCCCGLRLLCHSNHVSAVSQHSSNTQHPPHTTPLKHRNSPAVVPTPVLDTNWVGRDIVFWRRIDRRWRHRQ